jgi:hypothetical protein
VFALQCIQAKHGQKVLDFYPAAATKKRNTPRIRLDDMAVVISYLDSLDHKVEAWLTPLKQARPNVATLKSLLKDHFKKSPSSKKVADSRKLGVWYKEVATYCFRATEADLRQSSAQSKEDDEEDNESVEDPEDGPPSDSSGTDETLSDEEH